MRKITLFLSLFLAFVGMTATAQNFTPSDAPSGDEWAADTHWYFIQNAKGGWLSTASGYVDGNALLLTGMTRPASDEGFWCVVGNETDGYKFYNKAAGTGSFLGMTGSEDAARVQLYSSDAEEGVYTSFDITTTTYGTEWNAVKEHGTDSQYWNQRGNYLALWNSTWATAGDAGSAFKFVSLTDLYEDAKASAQNMITLNQSATWFKLSDEAVAKLQEVANEETPAELTIEKVSQVEAALNAAVAMERLETTVTDGTKVLITNLQQSSFYAYARTDAYLGSSAAQSYRSLWTMKQNADGDYLFYNEYTGKYFGGIPASNNTKISLVDEGDACAYTLSASPLAPGYCRIYDKDFEVSDRQNLHMVDWDGIVRWDASNNASQFLFVPYDDTMATTWAETLLATVDANCGMNVGDKIISDELQAAIDALTAAKGDMEKYRTLETAYAATTDVRTVEAGKFYLIEAAKQQGKYLRESYDQQANNQNALYCTELGENIVPALWQFTSLTEEGKTDLFHIQAVNSQSYMSKTSWGYDMSLCPADADNIGEYDIANKDHVDVAHAVTLVYYTNDARSDRGTASLRNNSNLVTSWNATGSQNNFFIKEATEIPVTVSAAKYATLNLPFAVKVNADVTAYTAEEGTEEVTLTEIEGEVIPANTPVILEAEAGTYSFEIDYAATDAALATALSGTTVPETIAEGATAYILKSGSQGIGMYLVNSESDRTIPANKAYLGSTTAAVAVKKFNLGGDVTGIDGVEATTKSDVYYDLNGRRVLYPANGVFVKGNGQKVFIK